MTADVLKDSYLMATGYAALMGADSERQHLFARRYDYAVTPAELEQHWKAFESEPNLHRCADCGIELDTETRYQFVAPNQITYVCRDHFLERDAKRRGVYRPTPETDECPFCKPNWPDLDIVTRPSVHVRVVRPLNPVTEGHVLVIHDHHTADAAVNPHTAAVLMHAAADYVRFHQLQANIITSIGPDATQTVRHTHVHVVPRRRNDGLSLPWTGQTK